LARLIEQLINEDKVDKAEKVADLAMEKMPVDDYEYYTLLEPYISSYYEIGAKEKAKKLYKQVSKKYQENLTYYSELEEKTQERYISEIVTDIQRYRGLVDILVIYNDKDLALEETKKFNDYLKLFNHFTGEEEPEETFPLDDKDIAKDTIDSIIKAQE
jgi:tetratricopeptide (TPR) repeat protein